MKNELITVRTLLSFGNEEFEFLSKHSDHPIENGYIFSRVFTRFEAFQIFLSECETGIGLSSDTAASFLKTYDTAFFEAHSLVLMFSDERSGSSRLRLEQAERDGDRIKLTILRTRGLTMDMAYLFLFLVLDETDITSSEVQILNDPNSEAGIF